MEQEDVVLVEKKGRLGLITLNRPKAVNALSLEMVQKLDRALEDLEQDEQIAVVAVVGAGERGLCAGGDVRALYTACTEDAEAGLEFFRNEYALDLRIHDFPKPYVPIMSGLVLGGGVGISAPGSHRVATDSTRIGMPETGIGFSPDVGGSNLLSRGPGQTGALMALTGQHAGGADALYLGLADYYVPDASVPALLAALQTVQGGSEVGAAIRRFQAPVPAAPLAAAREWVDEVFSAETVEGILDRLRAVVEQAPENDAAAVALESMEHNSPTGQKVALEALRRAREQSFAQTLDQDFRLAGNAIFGHDMREGIRAQVVDKGRNPQWSPAAPEEVDRDAVLAFFEPVPEQQDLGLAGEPVILVEVPAEGVGLIRLNRPKALNALNAEVMHAVVEQARAWDADPGIKAVVITGSQKAFAAGADIKEMASKTYPEMAAADWFADWKGLTEVRIPVIAAVSGHALGGGCELAMMCDLLVAGEGARFGQPEVNLGVMPGMGGSQRLARAVGKAKAMDMVLTGRTMGAEEAERAGLVSRIVADEAVLETALEIAGTIASKSRPVETAAKEAVNTAFETTLAHGIEHERRVFHSLFALEDQKEGMAAFSEKREARFRDR